MGTAGIIITALALSMDAFAAALCRGLAAKRLTLRNVLLSAAAFGGAQAVMPLIGYILGSSFAEYIAFLDHWIAFAILTFIGGKTVFDVIYYRDTDCAGVCPEGCDTAGLMAAAFATAIDALAAGISFAFLNVSILKASLITGGVTFAVSAAGVAAGHFFGKKYRTAASALGGIVLILIGIKILYQGLHG